VAQFYRYFDYKWLVIVVVNDWLIIAVAATAAAATAAAAMHVSFIHTHIACGGHKPPQLLQLQPSQHAAAAAAASASTAC